MTWEALWAGRSLASSALLPLSWVYGLGLRLRPPVIPERVEGLQVVSVGNLVVGGAGKTPVVALLASWALQAGRSVAVLSRGYGRRSASPVYWAGGALPAVEEVGDEPRWFARRLPGVHLFVGADRVAAAQRARALGCTVALLDDGFQHRRLHRDVDVLIDVGVGNGRLLPAGPLREPVSAATRASVLWARDGAKALSAPHALRVEANHSLDGMTGPSGERVAELRGQRVVVLAGLARPSTVVTGLETAGAEVVGQHLYADHHSFTSTELAAALADAESKQARVVTTEKDAERLPEGAHVWVLHQRLKLSATDEAALRARLGWTR
ncbi:MAG: tetraacyldisaccharide 4'-kinase [Archangium sp.]|nr:tetraacyldisaccharide 4'-kinase [Archangium sp.]